MRFNEILRFDGNVFEVISYDLIDNKVIFGLGNDFDAEWATNHYPVYWLIYASQGLDI